MSPVICILVSIVTLVFGLLVGYIYRKNVGEKAIGSAEQKAKNLILDAQNKSETIKKEITLEAKEEAHRLRTDAERDAKERRMEIQRAEKRLAQKEESVDRKLENIDRKVENISRQENEIQEKRKELDSFLAKQIEELEKISGMTAEEAKQLLLAEVEKDVRHDASVMIKDIESKAKEEADRRAKEIIS